ncbi:MAG: hypothetical protein ACRDK4_11215 [Solirubrobacteraceae bacterium]
MALREGRVLAIGEAKLRELGTVDLKRLLRIKDPLDAPQATIILASATGVRIPRDAPGELITIEPGDVYG